MTAERQELESLGRDVTRGGIPPAPSDRVQSLGEQDTGADVIGRSTASDLRDLADDWDNEQPDLESLESRYDIGEPLGRGGMGDVRRAVDRRLNRAVAIKRIRDDLVKSRRAAERFLAEARAVAALNHFNIVQIYDFGRDAEGHFIAMELVEGRSLAEHLAADGAFPTDVAVEIVSQLCDALSLAHSRGVIHRDIKPANILLAGSGRMAGAGPQGSPGSRTAGASQSLQPRPPGSAAKIVPKLTDFGLARVDGGDGGGHTQTGAVLGTIDYMPPEQRRDATQVDARSDLWSLAATLYEMLTGESPAIMRVDQVPDSIRDVLLKALETDPDQRYATADEFRDALFDARSFAQTTTGNACRACGHVNTPDATFCLNCGKAVHDVCLSCDQPLDHKAEFCGKCGANVRQDLERHAQKLQAERKNIARLQNEFQHHAALQRLDLFTEKRHAALGKFVEWANHTRGGIQQEIEELERSREHLLATARARAADRDADGVVRTLDMVPEPFRNDAVQSLLQDAQDQLTEIKRLRATIRKGLDTKTYDKVLPYVERLVELEPTDAQARQLRNKLRQRFPQLAGRKKSLAAERKPKPQAAVPVILVDTPAAEVPTKQPAPVSMTTPVVSSIASASAKRPRSGSASRRKKLPKWWWIPPAVAAAVLLGVIGLWLSRNNESTNGSSDNASRQAADSKNDQRSTARTDGKPPAALPRQSAVTGAASPGSTSTKAAAKENAPKTGRGKRRARPKLANGIDDNSATVLTQPFADFGERRAPPQFLRHAVFSRNGDRVVLSGATAQCWQIAPSIKFLSEYDVRRDKRKPVSHAASDLSPDGSRIVTAAGFIDGDCHVWDAARGTQLAQCSGHQRTVRDPRFLPDGETVLCNSDMKSFGRFSIKEPRVASFSPQVGTLTLAAVSRNGNYVLLLGPKETLILARYPGLKTVWSAKRNRRNSFVAAFSPDASRVATASYTTNSPGRSTLTVLDVASGKVLQRWEDHGEMMRDLLFENSGKRIVTAGNYVRVWDVETGKHLRAYRCGGGSRNRYTLALAAASDGKSRLVVDSDGRLFRIPLEAESTGDGVPTGSSSRADGATRIDANTTIQLGKAGTRQAIFSRDASRVVLQRLLGDYETWQLRPTVKRLSVFRVAAQGARELSSVIDPFDLSPDGKHCVVSHPQFPREEPAVSVWDTATGRRSATPTGTIQRINGVAFLPNSREIVASGYNPLAVRWSLDDPVMRQFQPGNASGRHRITVAANGKFVGIAGTGLSLVVTYPEGRVVWSQSDRSNFRCNALAISDDGRRFAVAIERMEPSGRKRSQSVDVWSMDSKRLIQRWVGFPSATFVNSLRFANGGKTLMAAGKRLWVWDVDSGKERFTYPMRSPGKLQYDYAVGLWASPDGGHIHVVSSAGRILTFDLKTAKSQPATGPGPTPTERSAVTNSTPKAAKPATQTKQDPTQPEGAGIVPKDAATIAANALRKPLVEFHRLRPAKTSAVDVVFSRKGDRLLLTHSGQPPQSWQIEPTVKFLAELDPSQTKPRLQFQFANCYSDLSPDANLVVTSLVGRSPRRLIWDAETGRILAEVKGTARVGQPRFTLNGRQVLFSTSTGAFARWSTKESSLQIGTAGGLSQSSRVVQSPDGALLAIAGRKQLHLVRYHSASVLWSSVIASHHVICRSIVFDRKSLRVAATFQQLQQANSRNWLVVVWDVKTGRTVAAWSIRGEQIGSLLFERDGKRLVTVSDRIRIWDVESGKNLHAYECASRVTFVGIATSSDRKARLTINYRGKMYRIPHED